MFNPPPNPDDVNAPPPSSQELPGAASHEFSIAPPARIRYAQIAIAIFGVVWAIWATSALVISPNFEVMTGGNLVFNLAFYFGSLTVLAFLAYAAYQLENQKLWTWITLITIFSLAFIFMALFLFFAIGMPGTSPTLILYFTTLFSASIVGTLVTPSAYRWVSHSQ